MVSRKVIAGLLMTCMFLFVLLSQLMVSAKGDQNGEMRLDFQEESLEVSLLDTDQMRIEKVLNNLEFEVIKIVAELDVEKADIFSDILFYRDGELTIMIDNIRSGGVCNVVAIYQGLKVTNQMQLIVRSSQFIE